MIWLALLVDAVIFGVLVARWLWSIPLPTNLTTSGVPASIALGTLLSVDGKSYGRLLVVRGNVIVIQPHHPWRRHMAWGKRP